MAASDALRDFITPLLPGWRTQFGRWMDGNTADRYAVIDYAGGVPASLVRRPQFIVSLYGALGDSEQLPYEMANLLIEAMRQSSGEFVFLEAGEASSRRTSDGRPISEIAVSAITN